MRLRSVACIAFVAGTCAACSEQGGSVDTLPTPTPALERSTEAMFGDAPSDQVVARVAEHVITTGEVAAYLQLFPVLTVQQAVDDLVDLHAVAASAPADALAAAEAARTDARRDALAYAWLHHVIWDDPALEQPPADEVRSWIEDAERSAPFGAPELLQVSHLLIQLPQTATDADVAEVTEQLSEARARLMDLGRPPAAFDLHEEAERLQDIVADRVPDEDDVRVETHFSFPRVPSGPARWSGVESVVQEFAEAAWPLQPQELSEPVRTSFGMHLILAEHRTPAHFVSEEQRVEMAEQFSLASIRAAAFSGAFGPTMQRTTVYANDENIGVLGMTAEERLAAEAESQSGRFRSGR